MHKDYEKLFKQLEAQEPPAGLFEKVMNRIQKEQQLLTLKRRIVIFSAGLMGSVVSFVFAFRMAQTDIIKSDFLRFFSLIFSDFGIATHYWQNFAMALLERLPAISLVLFLSCLLVFVGLLRHLLRDIKLILIIKQA